MLKYALTEFLIKRENLIIINNKNSTVYTQQNHSIPAPFKNLNTSSQSIRWL